MKTRLKLRAGAKGTKKLVEMYGDDLVCVRYRYDEATGTRLKTIEIVIERKSWTPPPPRYSIQQMVPVRISYTEEELKQQARAAGGRWDPIAKAWFIPYGRIRNTPLEKHIILDALDK